MSVTINAKGTSVPSFTIGKKGTTIYQGSVDPVGSNTVINGDYWLDGGTNTLKTRITGTWLAPKLNSLTIPTGTGTNNQVLKTDGTGILSFTDTVSTVSVVTANGVSGTVATPTTTPAITITLGAITPTSVAATGTVTGSNISGSNTGDQSITLTGDITGGPSTASIATTLATVNSNTGSFGTATAIPVVTVNAKGLITAVSTVALGATSLATNLAGGTTGALHYQSAPNVSAFLAAGTSSQVLIGGASAPAWSSTPSGLTSISATTFTGALTGNATTASALATARNISMSGDGTWTVSFSGSGDVTAAMTLATVNAAPQTDTFRKITVNNKGLVTATSAVAVGDITTALGYTPVNRGGDTMTGLLVLSADPAVPLGAATKQYVDTVAAGLTTKASVITATTATLAVSSAGTVTYANGAAGVGATLTTTGNFNSIGGFTTANGNRILVKNEAIQVNNGIYVRTSATVLTRATDFDNSPPGEIVDGDFTFVSSGTLAGTNWVQITPAPITVGSTIIVFTQLSGPGVYTAGTGISITNNVIANTGVLSIAGTTNQITASASTGAITLSLPSAVTIPGIMTASSFTGAGTGLTGTAASLSVGGSAVTLANIRTFSATGDATAAAQNFDGSQNVALPMVLATVTQSSGANFVKITLDTKGRVTGNTAVVAGDITPLINATYVLKAGDTMTGALTNRVGFTARTATSTDGYINVQPGTPSQSGFIEFMSSTGGIRQAYIGVANTNSATDTGTLPYTAGLHNFSGAMAVTTTTGSTNTLSVTDTGVNGGNLKLTGPGTNPAKYIRANTGNLEIINSAYNAALWVLSDAGNATLAGTEIVGNASANKLQFAGATAGNGPNISVTGSDTDISLLLASKNAGSVNIQPRGLNGFVVGNTVGAVNYWYAFGNSAGSIGIQALGTATDIEMTYSTKGAGNAVFYTGANERLRLTTTGATLTGGLIATGGSHLFGNTTNGAVGIEVGYQGGAATTPFIDFHSGATAVDFDSRIIASGGTGVSGGGTLSINAASVAIPGILSSTGNIIIDNATPTLTWNENDQGVDLKRSAWLAFNGGMVLQEQTDAGAFIRNVISVTRGGAINFGGGLSVTGQVNATASMSATTITGSGLVTGAGLRSTGNNNVDIVATGYASNQPARGLRLLGGPTPQWVSSFTLESDGSGVPSTWLNVTSDDSGNSTKAIGLFRSLTTFNIVGVEKMRLHSDGALLVNQTTSDGVSKIQVTGSGTSSANPIVAIQQVNNRLWFNAKAAGGWNSLIQTDDQVIISQGASVDTAALTIGTWTGNATAIRITGTTVALSASSQVTAPTPPPGTVNTQVATTAFVRTNSGLFTVSAPPPPSSPVQGDRWLSTDSGRIYTYFNDGDSSQWVEFAGDSGIVASGTTIPTINPSSPKEGDYRIVGGVLSFWIQGAWVQSVPGIYA